MNDMESLETQNEDAKQLRERNLRWFSRHYPPLAKILATYKPVSKLIDEGDGWYNVSFSGQTLYQPSAKEVIEAQLDSYMENPPRLFMAPPQPTSFDKYAANFLHRTIERIHDEGIEFTAKITSTKAYYLFIFGFGLGAHVDKLVEESNCQALLIFEPNVEFLSHALDLYDFEALEKVMNDRGGFMDIVVSDNQDAMFHRVKNCVRVMNPCSYDGTILFTNYHNTSFVPVQNRLQRDAFIILSGLGFYFDETIMIQNTYANLKNENNQMARYATAANRKYPAFVVGSGPSLDKDIEWIKENQENAVIFSCGSGIMPLMRAGVQPDFQVELENVPELYPMFQDTIKYIDVSKVRLLASTTLDPRVPGFFDNTSLFFRPALSSFPIFARKEDAPLHNGSPSVTNAGLALAQHFGFRNIYIFGTDMGSKVQGLAHSKTAWQNSDEGHEVDIKFNLPVRGNFGGTVYTYDGMNWTRDEFELAIKAFHKGRHYYNCSDGAFIAGTVAKHAKSIKFPQYPYKKDKEISNITDAFKPYDKRDLDAKWNDEDMRNRFKAYCDSILACLEKPEDIESKRALTEINKILFAPHSSGIDLGVAMIFRGTFWQAFLAIEFYMVRIEGEKENEIAREIYKEELTALLNYVLKKANADLGNLSEWEWEPRDREVVIEKEEWV